MRLDFFCLFSDGSCQRRDHRGEAVQARVGGLHLLIGLFLRVSQSCNIYGVFSNLLIMLQLLFIEPAQCRPELLEAAKSGAHGK